MSDKINYTPTLIASYIAYVVQAVVNNLAPLLFVTFGTTYGIPIAKISLLIGFHFGVQMLTDFFAARYADRIGYRASVVAAHFLAAVGLFGLAVLPNVLPDPFVGILIAAFLYAVGGGLIEVVISPLVEACPTRHKSAAMSLLHSFYSWGQLAMVALSTLFFVTAGIENWRWLAVLWGLLPLANAFLFLFVPIAELGKGTAEVTPPRSFLRTRLFWLFIVLMIAAGAAELTVCQWASAFLEAGLGIDKATGDLVGLCLFSLFMGAARVLYGVVGERVSLSGFMVASGLLCVASYLLISLSSSPIPVLIGCALCGFSVGIMWPGTYSMAAGRLSGGTAMFALLAVAGDLGCTLGPSLAGWIADACGGDLARGILFGTVFPALLVIGNLILLRGKKKE